MIGGAPAYGSAPGALDNTFGHGGIAETVSNMYATAILFPPHGDIVVVADNRISAGTDYFAVMRFLPNGALDTSFGTNGVTSFPFGPLIFNNTPTSGALQSDGKILVAASAAECVNGCPALTAFVRFNPNGTPDQTFGQDGTELITSLYGGSPDILAELTTGDLLTWSRNVIAQYSPSGASRPQVTGGTRLAISTKSPWRGSANAG